MVNRNLLRQVLAQQAARRHDARPYDLFVFQLGNSHYHDYMLPLIRSNRGIVVLHEYKLQCVSNEFAHGTGDRAVAPRADAANGAQTFDRPDERIPTGRADRATPLRELLQLAAGVAVHSSWSWRRVRPLTQAPVFLVPQAVELPALGTREEERVRLGLSLDEFIIATLGTVRPSKRLPSIIRAAGLLRQQVKQQLCLLVVGEATSEDIVEARRLAEAVGLGSAVCFAGRVPLADLSGYARAADVCFQLRHPTHGETSAALLRAMAAGGACVISESGPLEEIPPSVALRVRPDHDEVGQLTVLLSRLYRDRELRTTLSAAAEGHVRAFHGFKEAAERYMAMIDLTCLEAERRDWRWLEGACDALARSSDPIPEGLINGWAALRHAGRQALRRPRHVTVSPPVARSSVRQ